MVHSNSEVECVHDFFGRWVTRMPDAIALQTRDCVWTYSQLDRAANRIANELLDAGVERGCFIGVCCSRSPEAIAALLAISKVGCAYVPLDYKYPADRLSFMLGDIDIKYLIVDTIGLSKIRSVLDKSHIVLDPSGPGNENFEVEISCCSSDLAYVMYTSGSTGAPKGVMIEHRGIIRLVSKTNYVDLSPQETLLQLAPLSFDASTFEVWGALLNGARLAMMPDTFSLTEIAYALGVFGITTLWLTSGLFNALIDEYPRAFENLKQLLIGGDVLSSRHVRKAMEMMKGGSIINGYGPTENTTFTCCHHIRLDDLARASIPIGRPVSKTQVHILDQNLRPVAQGQIGEICVGGDGLARGYWKRPVLTAQAFVVDPFSSDPLAKLYRTADLGHYNSEGLIEFDGRIDLQVKVRGFRVELLEIEANAELCPGINAAVVVVKNSGAEHKSLCCYFVTSKESGLIATDLAAFLRKRLPEYMWPSEFIPLAELPLDANGKIDRKLLAEKSGSSAGGNAGSTDGADQLELELSKMLKQLLPIPGISLDDDLLRLGMQSLLTARFFAQIHSRFGKKLPLATLVEARTLRHLAAAIRDDHWLAPWSSLVALKKSGSQSPFFIVHAIGGNIVGYDDLARSFPADQPVYALQAKGLDGENPAASSVEEMAAHYIRAVQTVQPVGPYFLGGWSAGGRVAFEMACQLGYRGHEVAFLAIFDTTIASISGLKNVGFNSIERMSRLLSWNCHQLASIGFRSFAQRKLTNLRRRIHIMLFESLEVLKRRFHWGTPAHLGVKEAFTRAIEKYQPGVFNGDAVVFRTPDARYYSRDPYLGWRDAITGDLSFRDVPGNHDDIFKTPNLQVVVQELTAALSQARKKHTERAYLAETSGT